MTKNQGYLFPIPVDPGELACFKVYVPNDNLYLAAFWSSYQFLASWAAWARDDDHNAKDVAAVWMEAFQRARTEYVAGGGCMPAFRLSEDDCLLEVNCGTDDDPNWQSVFTTPHPMGKTPIPYPPDTPEYIDDTARCIAAARITAQLYSATNTLANDFAELEFFATFWAAVFASVLLLVPGDVILEIALASIAIASGATAEEMMTAVGDINWPSVRDHLACYINRDGTVSESGRTLMLAWMADQYPLNIAWGIAQIIIQNVNAAGLTADARITQNDIDEECAVDYCTPDCQDTHNGTTWEGVYGYPDPPPYIADEGVRSAGFSDITGFHIANGGFAGATINEFSITVNLIHTGDNETWELKYDDVTVHTFAWVAGVHTYVFSTPTAASSIRCFMDIGSGSIGSPTDPAALITEICVTVAI